MASSTIALIRRLTALRPSRKVLGHIPPPLPLDPIQQDFARKIALVSEQARRAFLTVEPQILADFREHYAAEQEARTDAAGDLPTALQKAKQSQALVRKAQARFEESLSNRELVAVTERIGERTSEHQKANLSRQLRSAIGVPYEAIEKPIRAQVPKWSKETVSLIKTVPDRYFESLEQDVADAYAGGMHPDTFAANMSARYGVSQTNGERIARTSISQINSDLTRARHESLGITSYTWRTVNDSRVRDGHAALEGQVIDYDDPPMGGGTTEDEEGHAGDAINDRCWQEPVLSDLL